MCVLTANKRVYCDGLTRPSSSIREDRQLALAAAEGGITWQHTAGVEESWRVSRCLFGS